MLQLLTLKLRKNVKCFKRRAENLISLFFTCLHLGRSTYYIPIYALCVRRATCFYIYFSCAKNITLPSKHVQIKIKVVLSGKIYVQDLCQTCLYHPRAKHIMSVGLYLYPYMECDCEPPLSQSISLLHSKYYLILSSHRPLVIFNAHQPPCTLLLFSLYFIVVQCLGRWTFVYGIR